MVRELLKVDRGALTRGFPVGSTKRVASVLSKGDISSRGGLARLSLLRTQVRIELLASLNRVRLLSTRALAAGCRIIALAADSAVGVCKGGHSVIV
jgi:hypothetical protein